MRSSSVNSASSSKRIGPIERIGFEAGGIVVGFFGGAHACLFQEFQHGLLIDLVAHRGHVVAAGHGDGAAVGEGGGQRAGRAGERVVLAAHHQHRLAGGGQFGGGIGFALSARMQAASATRSLPGMLREYPERLRGGIGDRRLVGFEQCRGDHLAPRGIGDRFVDGGWPQIAPAHAADNERLHTRGACSSASRMPMKPPIE